MWSLWIQFQSQKDEMTGLKYRRDKIEDIIDALLDQRAKHLSTEYGRQYPILIEIWRLDEKQSEADSVLFYRNTIYGRHTPDEIRASIYDPIHFKEKLLGGESCIENV